ncbi:protein translocase subunit SecD, partial [bacterium]
MRRSTGKAIPFKLPDGKPNPEYANIIKDWTLILSGPDLANAVANPAGDGFQPLMNFSPAGAQKLERWSRAFRGKQENIAAVLDGRVISIAAVNQDAILSDNAIIQGQFDTKYVQTLVSQLNSGALPVDLELIGAQTVDASIGQVALQKMVFAGVIAFGVISLFMLVYYALPGLVAVVALGLYILFTLTILKLFNATFSLAAIAGFILSVGMAVDANILVFERVKEELRHGRGLASAIELGFRRALPAIIDSNACTILTSIVLANVGTGPVKGFAITLVIGVLVSLFTAVTVTRSLLIGLAGTSFGSNPKAYAVERNWFKGIEKRADTNPLRIVERPAKWFLISALTVVVGVPFALMGGFKFNVEFTGGSEATYAVTNTAPSGP